MVEFKPLSLRTVVDSLGLTTVRQPAESAGKSDTFELRFLGEPKEVSAQGVAFLISESFLSDLPESTPDVLIVNEALLERALLKVHAEVKMIFAVQDAYLALAKFSEILMKNDDSVDWGAGSYRDANASSNASAYVHPSASVHASAVISPFSSVGAFAKIGARTVLLPNVHIGPGAEIGEDCLFFSGCIVYPKTKIGNRVRLHANVVLGSDGFGYARGPKGAAKIWHLGRVVVQDDVEIGSGTTVDRGTMKDTVIERGVKIDNQVQIGHNVQIKSHAILCAQVGLAGNSKVGVGSVLAGKVGVGDKVEIGDGVTVGASSGVSKDVPNGEILMGALLARPKKEWWKLHAAFNRLPELFERVKKLEGGPK